MSDERFRMGGKVGGIDWTTQSLYLDHLVDTAVDDPTDGFVLTYEASSGKWKPVAAGAGADTKTNVFEAGVQVGTIARAINFDGTDFNVTEEAGPGYFTVTFAGTGMSAHDMTGAYHTEDATGAVGNVIRATGLTSFAWATLGHGDLGSVTSDQHHAQQHTLSGADHTGDLAYTQIDAIVDIAGVGANNLLSRADHVHTDVDGSSKITYSNLSGIPSTFDPNAHDLTSAYHTDSGLTAGHFLKATSPTTFAWQVHGLGASDVGAYTTAQVDSAIDTDIATHAALATVHQDAPGLIATHAAIATAHQDAPGLIATHAAISGVHHSQSHVLSGGDHTASGLTIGHVIMADSAIAFSWQAPSYYNSFTADFAAESLANLTTRNHASLSDAPVNAHHNQSHALAGGDHTATGLTVGWVISADTATTFSWKAPTGGADPNAIHDNVSNEIQVITPKASPAGADVIIIEDSAATWAKKSVLISNLPAGSPSFGAPTGGIDIGDAAVEGTSGDSTRADHQHAFTAPGVGYPLDIANTESDGTASTPARSDHVHAHGSITSANAHRWNDLAAMPNTTTTTIGKATPTAVVLGVGHNGTAAYCNTFYIADHAHTTTVGSGGQIDYTDLTSIPSTFDPDAHDLTSAYHTDSGLTGGHFLKADTATTFSWQVHGLSASDVGAATTIHNLIDTTNHPVAGLTTGHFLKALSATTYGFQAHGLTEGGAGTDTTAIHDNVSDEIHLITAKGAPVGADVIIIEDSAATWQKKSVLISNLPAGSPSFGVPTGNIDIGDAAVEGTSGDSTRADHQHAFTAPTAGYPQDIAATELDGTSSTPARADHVHAHGSGYSADAHHAQVHALATTGDHTGELPLADLAVGVQGSIIKRGAADWEELGKGTDTYVLKSGAVDLSWGTVDWSELTGSQPAPVAHTLATSGPHTDTLPLTDLAVGTQGGIIRRGAADWEEFARGTQYKYLRAGVSDVEWQARKFSITACITSPAVGHKTVWRAPFACTCVEIQGRQKGGTSVVINARYNGTTDVATADLTLTLPDTWYSTTGINQTAWTVDSWLEVEIVTVGSATEVTIQVEFTEP